MICFETEFRSRTQESLHGGCSKPHAKPRARDPCVPGVLERCGLDDASLEPGASSSHVQRTRAEFQQAAVGCNVCNDCPWSELVVRKRPGCTACSGFHQGPAYRCATFVCPCTAAVHNPRVHRLIAMDSYTDFVWQHVKRNLLCTEALGEPVQSDKESGFQSVLDPDTVCGRVCSGLCP